MLVDEDGQLGTLPLALIGAAVGGLAGLGYALYTGKDPVKYGIGGALLGGAAGLTLGMTVGASVAAGGTAEAGALAWGTKAIVGAGMSSSRQTLEVRSGKRKEISVEDMVFESVAATTPVPKSIAIPAALTYGTVELAKGTAAAKQNDGEMAMYHTVMGSASLISGGSQLLSGGGTPGPLVPAGATANASRSVSAAPAARAEAAPPVFVAMSSPESPSDKSQGPTQGKPSNKQTQKNDAVPRRIPTRFELVQKTLDEAEAKLLKVTVGNEGQSSASAKLQVSIDETIATRQLTNVNNRERVSIVAEVLSTRPDLAKQLAGSRAALNEYDKALKDYRKLLSEL
jgi:hypothetical protein